MLLEFLCVLRFDKRHHITMDFRRSAFNFMMILGSFIFLSSIFTASTTAAGIILTNHPRRVPQLIISKSLPSSAPSITSPSGSGFTSPMQDILSPVMRLSPLKFYSNNGRVHLQYRPILPRVMNKIWSEVEPIGNILSFMG